MHAIMPAATVLVFLENKTLITDQMFNYKSNATLYFEKKKKDKSNISINTNNIFRFSLSFTTFSRQSDRN